MFGFVTATVPVPVVLVVFLILAIVVLVLVIWSIRRHRDPDLVIECDAPLLELMPSLTGLTQGAMYEGNAVEVLENGAFFDVMLEEIKAATRSVHFETFLWKEGVLGARLVDALAERSRAGVPVRVLVDADGGKAMGSEAGRRLTEAGCKFKMHHPRHVRNIGVFNERDHRKLVVLDGHVALVGAIASSTVGLKTRRTAIMCAISACVCAAPSCMRCSRCSARTGSRTPANCSSVTTCSLRSTSRATWQSTLPASKPKGRRPR